MDDSLVLGAAAFLGSCFIASLAEYAGHRLMHGRLMLARKHAEHHRDGLGQGWLSEFWEYVFGGLPIIAAASLLCFFVLDSWPAALGYVLGSLTYAALAAYAHQVQHERPDLVFWLKRPVHHLHHKHHMLHHNFGILVDFWDRVFGTYMPAEWHTDLDTAPRRLRHFFQIKWY